MKENSIKFLRTKDYKLIKEIGQGGSGRTALLLDELINVNGQVKVTDQKH